MEIKIDRTTLPRDGEHVRFKDDKEEWHEGYFVAGDDLFHVNDSKWFFVWYVHEWESLESPSPSKEVEPVKEEERGENYYIWKGIDFANKEQFKLSGEAYRSGVGFGYACGYQDGEKSSLSHVKEEQTNVSVEEAAKEDIKEELQNLFYSMNIPKAGKLPLDFCEQIADEVFKLLADWKGKQQVPPTPNRRKPFIVANVRDLLERQDKEEMSYSRMVEIMNEMVFEWQGKQDAKQGMKWVKANGQPVSLKKSKSLRVSVLYEEVPEVILWDDTCWRWLRTSEKVTSDDWNYISYLDEGDVVDNTKQ